MSKFWIKLHHSILDSAQVARLPDSSYRRYIEALLMAGEADEGGFLPELGDMSWRVRVADAVLQQDLSRLALAGLLALRVDPAGRERWFVVGFAEDQSAATSQERVAQHRVRTQRRQAAAAASDAANVTPCVTSARRSGNGHVTERYRNVVDIDIDTEPDTDKESHTHTAGSALGSGTVGDSYDAAEKAVADALTSVTGIIPGVAGRALTLQFEQAVGKLAKIVTADQVLKAFGPDGYWYKASFGQRGQKPHIANVLNEIGRAVEWTEPAAPTRKMNGPEAALARALAKVSKEQQP